MHLHYKRLECAKNRDQSCSLIDVETYIMSLGHVKMLDLDSVQPTSQLVPYRKSRPMIDLRQNSENLKNHGTTKQSSKCTTTNTTTKIILMIICFIVIIFLFLSSYFVLERLNKNLWRKILIYLSATTFIKYTCCTIQVYNTGT